MILDTTMLIRAERRRGRLDDLVHDEDDVAMAAVTLAELLVGVALPMIGTGPSDTPSSMTWSPSCRSRHITRRWLDSHAALIAHARRAGPPRGAHDLIIAATAVARNREVVTLDAPGFADLPGVQVRG